MGHLTKDNDYFMTLLMNFTLFGIAISYAGFSHAFILVYRKNKVLTMHTYYDGLTGLPNVHPLKIHLKILLARCAGHPYRLCMININQFKRVNILYRFDERNRILKIVSRRIQGDLCETSTGYHLSGDRFVLWAKVKDAQFDELCVKTQNAIALSFIIHGKEHILSFKIAVISLRKDAEKIADILRNFGISVDVIQVDQSNHIAYYQALVSASVERKQQIESELCEVSQGIETDWFTLNDQSQLDVLTDEVLSFEVYARFHSRKFGHFRL